jgi:hypothetical protein
MINCWPVEQETLGMLFVSCPQALFNAECKIVDLSGKGALGMLCVSCPPETPP